MNGYLKDGEILAILPAPVDSRADTSIAWYEVRVNTKERRTLVNARDINGDNVATMEVKLLAANEVSITIEERNIVQLKEKLTLMRDDAGYVRMQIRSRDDEINITGVSSHPFSASATGRRRLRDNEQQLPKHWERLTDPLTTLADALKVRALDSNSWGCTSCMVLLAGVALGAGVCVEGNPAACAGALQGGAVFIENCGGVCA